MTTICFDGKELVADSRVSKLDVDHNQRIIAPVKLGDITIIGNDVAKIVTPKNFTLDGDQVLAVAIAGDARIMASLQYMDEHDLIPGNDGKKLTVNREMYGDAFYGQFSDLSCTTELIIVGARKWAHAKMTARPDSSFVDYEIGIFHRDGTGWAMGGSGYLSIQEAIKHPNMMNNGITLESMRTKSARKNVTLGIICDPMSGGPLRVWTEENGIESFEIEAGAEVVKEHLEAHGYGLDTPEIDNEVALRRVEEIKAERLTRAAA